MYGTHNTSVGIRPRTKNNRLSIRREKFTNCQGGGKEITKARSELELRGERR